MGQCKSKDQDFNAYAVFKWLLFVSLSTEALRKLKRDGTVQAWGQKTLRAIKLKSTWEQTWDSASLRKEVLSKVLKKTSEARFYRTARSKALKNKDRESNEGCASPPEHPTHLTPLSFCLSILCLFWISSHPQLASVRFSNNKGGRKFAPTKEEK
jgi:hypothetical protein